MQAWIWDFLSQEGFQPHGMCLLWRPDVFWAHVISDLVIASAYFSIPVALMWLALRRKDLIHRWVLVLFSSFIVACGITHLFGIWTMWVPSYGLEAIGKIVTAAVSMTTAILLWPLMPAVLSMPSSEQLAAQNRRLEVEIAERRAAETRLKELNDDLERRVAARTASLTRANKELREAREAADRSNQAKSDFLATMSHEIRTPMTGVLGMLEMLKTPRESDEQGRLLEVAKDSADSLLAIIDDILDHSRLEAGAVELVALPFSPRRTVEQVAALLRKGAEQKGLSLDVVLSDNLPEALIGDSARLRQILFNLAGNAIKFTDGGSVRLAVTERPCAEDAVGLLFSVTDTGIGIPKEAQERIFGRFSQADASTSERFGGSGLGLAICRDLVALMGGTIGVESTPGLGSLFWFTVPCRPGTAIDASTTNAERPNPARPLNT
jgi:signal transduction histidine kinase